MAKDFEAKNSKATSKTVVLTLKVDADNMAELYARVANIVAAVENSADVESVDVRDKKATANFGGHGYNTRAL
ncbi:hypothetical protein SEA_BILLNYE_156 [Streptomyces phage BillNye]|uniref:Uncharacterized protein n=2 Tax=Wilnyevirus billnye TaxID=2560486 RepID=A0A2L1IVW1_9CAUD|nr:hypothetical protein FDJ30_gp104 [Streptomyces phage BillNye]AVD99329.1 hypothetical protein SEA_BILLNYE_156 [Streptomyces phage BillNye]QBZ72412.1 hypothetical protein SEA_CIRCINUS_157 [Streptomyces phage Circinus]